MADRGSASIQMNRLRRIGIQAAAGLLAVIAASWARAADVKTLGHLKVPPNASVITVCADPVVQRVLSEDFRAHPGTGTPVVLTVTVNARALAPGVSIQDLSPGDPSVAEMLRAMGAEPPPIGDTGDKPLEDPYTMQARRQVLQHEDAMMQQFRGYVARRSDMANASPYNDIPADQMYQTAIVARASVSNSASEYKVVALVSPGDDISAAKKLVAEEIANAVLH